MLIEYKQKLEDEYKKANGISLKTNISVQKIREWCSKREKNLMVYSGIVEYFLDSKDSIIELNKGFYDTISFNLKKRGYHVYTYSPYLEDSIDKTYFDLSNVLIDDPFSYSIDIINFLKNKDKRVIFGTFSKISDCDYQEKINYILKLIDIIQKKPKIDVDVFKYEEEDSSYIVAQAKIKQKKRF